MTRRKQKRFAERKQITMPVVVLAGLPYPVNSTVAARLEADLAPTPKVFHAPSGREDWALYRPQTVETLIQAISGYAVRQRAAQHEPSRPSEILLAYVPSEDDEVLLRDFDFFVFPVRLTRLAQYDEFGRQYRRNAFEAGRYVVDSIRTATLSFSEVKRRLSSISPKEPLFMPPRNFKLTRGRPIGDVFRDMRRATVPWGGLLDGVDITQVTHEDLPRHVPRDARKQILTDSRGLLFPNDPTFHGPVRELEAGAFHGDRINFLRSSFRFGVPLVSGYHHDVQFPGTRGLGGQQFECCRRGLVSLNCDYANVYPNDFIREGNDQ